MLRTPSPNDPSFPSLWGLWNTGQVVESQTGTPGADIKMELAWDIATGSTTYTVGVVDTGIDYLHSDLASNVWSAPGQFTVTIGGTRITCSAGSHGFNAIANTCDPADDNGHGTHVSGTIGAKGNNGIGVVGVNWATRLMGLKFLDSHGNGSTSNAINAIEFGILANANVRALSNSYGGGPFSQAFLDEINRANSYDMLFAAAAGNNSSNNDSSPFYPASYNAQNVIAVAATDNRDNLASFSNYGSRSVHLGAPGVGILSTWFDGGYATLDGTSMATPHVSGTGALLRSVCQLPPGGIKQTILDSVDQVSSLSGKTITGGRLNAYRALQFCTGGTTSTATITVSYLAGSQPIDAGNTYLYVDGVLAGAYNYDESVDNALTAAQGLSDSINGLSAYIHASSATGNNKGASFSISSNGRGNGANFNLYLNQVDDGCSDCPHFEFGAPSQMTGGQN